MGVFNWQSVHEIRTELRNKMEVWLIFSSYTNPDIPHSAVHVVRGPFSPATSYCTRYLPCAPLRMLQIVVDGLSFEAGFSYLWLISQAPRTKKDKLQFK